MFSRGQMRYNFKSRVMYVFLIVIFIQSVSSLTNTGISGNAIVSDCFPSYECGEWSVCSDGLQERMCIDTKCGMKDIVERRFCQGECDPDIRCSSWGRCNYEDKITDVFLGEIKFGGYQERICRDVTGCIEDFTEERSCSDSYNLDVIELEKCGIKYLAAVDPSTRDVYARVPLDAWREEGELDLIFSDIGEYCDSCYNGVKDGDEEGVDCGGSCKKCKEEEYSLLYSFRQGLDFYSYDIFGSFSLSNLFIFLLILHAILVIAFILLGKKEEERKKGYEIDENKIKNLKEGKFYK